MPEAKIMFSCGPFARRSVRSFLEYEGVQWTEEKGLLRSTFVARGTDAQILLIYNTVQEWQRKLNGR